MTDIRFAKTLVLINCGVPLAVLLWDGWQQQLGADPTNAAIRTTGMMALIFLTLSLAITPVRKLTGWNALIQFRRTLGVYAFVYACLHFLAFFVLSQALNVPATLNEVAKRPYLVVGMTSLLLMLPLAVTSTNGMVKRLGAKRWQLLHRLAYPAAIAAVVHFYMQLKAKTFDSKPVLFAIVLAILLGYRLIAAIVGRVKPSSKARVKMWSGSLRVIEVKDETPTVRTFRLQSPDSETLPFTFAPGQYLNVALPIDGKKVHRSYTIASSPAERSYCELTIKREAQGVASNHLHAQVQKDDLLDVSAPAGRFTFEGKGSNSIVLIGGGVGITPLMSVIRYLTGRNWPGEIYLIYCARTESEIIFAEELDRLSHAHLNLHLTLSLTRSELSHSNREIGRITPGLIQGIVPNIASHRVHVCGPIGMMNAVTAMLRELDVPEDHIHTEAFESPAGHDSPDGGEIMAGDEAFDVGVDSEPKITFATSDKTVAPDPDATVLETAEALGIEIDWECRAGVCGRCKTRLVSGSVKMESCDALTPRDEAAHIILACQARPLNHVTVKA